MKPAFAQFAPTVPVTFAAAMGIALSLFLLPGAGVPSEPTPLLAVIGGAAGRVAADLPAPVVHHASTPVRSAATPARPAAARPGRLVARRQQAGARTHRTHHRARPRAVRPARSAPASVQAAAPAAPATPVTTRRSFNDSRSKKGKPHGHAYGHSRALEPAAVSPAPRAHDHGKAKALGHSSDHHSVLPPGQAKKAPTVPPPAPPAALPKSNGSGNEKNGGKK
jgi:hypothetical protein